MCASSFVEVVMTNNDLVLELLPGLGVRLLERATPSCSHLGCFRLNDSRTTGHRRSVGVTLGVRKQAGYIGPVLSNIV